MDLNSKKINFSPGSEARKIISEEFRLPKWEPFRNWFFENFNNVEKQIIQDKFYKKCEETNTIILFVPWFMSTYVDQYISVLERNYKLMNGQIITKELPPSEPFQIENDNNICNFLAFAKLFENDTIQVTCKQIKLLIKQKNYTNLYLNVLGEQILSIHNKIDRVVELINSKSQNPSNNSEENPIAIATPSIQPPPEIKDFKLESISELEKLLEEKFTKFSLNTLEEDFIKNIEQQSDYKQIINDQINKMDKWTDKPTNRYYYYNRPTPMDVLNEEQEYIINNSYSGRNIYEWNIDGFTEKQIYNTVHRILMYSTICKNNGNTDKNIAKMIIAGFTGQLKGWWDHYLTQQNRDYILNNIKQENEIIIENSVYTLIINIIEHFTGRYSDNSEHIRTLLQNLKCKTLTDFRWYKDTFLSRVMELPESNSSHWKSKFIDGLSYLFAERIRNKLRGNEINIPYDNFTYGKLINTCIQEGLNLCNEIKLNQQIKRQNLSEKKQLGRFCEQFAMDIPSTRKTSQNKNKNKYENNLNKYKKRKRFSKKKIERHAIRKHDKKDNKKQKIKCYRCGKEGHYAKNCWIKKKINNLQIDDEIKNTISKILINSESEFEENSSSEEYESSSENSEKIKALDQESIISDSDTSEENCKCQNNIINDKENEIYRLFSQMKNLEINVLDHNNTIELLKTIKDSNLRSQIIDQLNNIPSSSYTRNNQSDNISSQVSNEPYMMSKVYQMLREKQEDKTPTSLNDLKSEIENLKKEIKFLKQNNTTLEKRIEKIENKNSIDITENNKIIEKISENKINENFLNNIEMFISQKWHVKIILLIDNFYTKEFIALIDSGADLNVIQEGLIPTRYFEKTTHTLSHAGGEKLDISFKLPKAFICIDKKCIPTSFLLVKNISNQVILGSPFIQKIYPLIKVDNKGIIGTYNNEPIVLNFIEKPFQKILHNIFDNIRIKENQLNFLKQEINILSIEDDLKNHKLQEKIKMLHNNLCSEICNDLPNAFWNRKKHIVSLPYEDNFTEEKIPTKARPCQMNSEYLELCKNEIKNLLDKNIIRPSQSPWSCTAFYVNKHSEQERGAPRLVINYKPLNKVLKWIRHPIPNKKDLLDRLYDSIIFSKFDLKSGFWQIQINQEDRYKTAFNVPFGHYEWNVMPFGLKNAPSEFQKIMNDIFIPYSEFIIVYIDDILIFSKNIESHFKHLDIFKKLVIQNGLVYII